MNETRARVSIVGAGSIGTTIAYTLALRCPALDILLVNRDQRRAWARAFDMSHCAPELPGRAVRSGGLEDCTSSEVIVLTVGVLPKEDGTRSDVLRDNVEIYRAIVPGLAETCPSAVFIVVTNPVDAMAYAAWRLAGSPRRSCHRLRYRARLAAPARFHSPGSRPGRGAPAHRRCRRAW